MKQIVSKFLKLLNVPISGRYVQNLVQSHPDFPSLLSISDVLQRLGVNHVVTRIRKKDIGDLVYPFLLTVDNGYGRIQLIKNSKDLSKHENDLELWGGVVLAAEPSSQVNDNTNNDLYRVEGKIKKYGIGAVSAFAIILLLVFLYSSSWLLGILLITAILGFIVGYLLVTKELGIIYEAIDAFCNAGKKTSCDKLLKADVTLFGVRLSDAVVTYFLFEIVALGMACALSEIAQTIFVALAFLGALTCPVILFSLYYQYFVAKTWCRLCITVDAILLVQASLLGYGVDAGFVTLFAINFIVLIILALFAVIIFSSVLIVKASAEKFEKLNKRGVSGNQIKQNVSVFTFLLGKQRIIDTKAFQTEMKLGNADAPINIIMASDLYCVTCKKKHEVVAQLVATYPDKISITFRFVKSDYDIEYKTESLKPLLDYWHQHIQGNINEAENTATFLHEWFTIWDLQKFKKKYQYHTETEKGEVDQLAVNHYAWADESNIIRTPTFFINGFELPREYAIDDLLAMVPELAEKIGTSLVNEKELQNV